MNTRYILRYMFTNIYANKSFFYALNEVSKLHNLLIKLKNEFNVKKNNEKKKVC